MADDDYKFPDESGTDGPSKKQVEQKTEVEIVDDTPADDRHREPLPKNLVEEIEKDDLSEYSEKVKIRMSQMKKAFHDERREKERAQRERDESARYAEAKHKENQDLKSRLTTGEKIFIKEVSEAAKTNLDAAKAKLKAAYETNDAQQIVDAQEILNRAVLKQQETEKFIPTPVQEEKDSVKDTSRTAPPAQAIDQKAKAWQDKNSWFGSDEEMTSAALGLHRKLEREGVSIGSDEYYQKIDKTMRRRFPENFEDAAPQKETKPPPNVVAPASRSTAPRKITINSSQAALAKRLGISPEAYAREFAKLNPQGNE